MINNAGDSMQQMNQDHEQFFLLRQIDTHVFGLVLLKIH